MEELPVEPVVGRIAAPAVQLVPHDGVVDIGHVDANLVGPPGKELALEKRVPLVLAPGLEALEHREGGDRLPRAGLLAMGASTSPVSGAI